MEFKYFALQKCVLTSSHQMQVLCSPVYFYLLGGRLLTRFQSRKVESHLYPYKVVEFARSIVRALVGRLYSRCSLVSSLNVI